MFYCIHFPVEVFTFLHSCRICLMKSFEKPSVLEFSIVFMFESLHVLGTAILFLLGTSQTHCRNLCQQHCL